MIRKTHKKSRLGCTECKKRHIKCDETRPICANCRSTSRTCSFDNQSGFTNNGERHQVSEPSVDIDDTIPNHNAQIAAEVNMDHMEIFHHFLRETYKTILPGPFADDYCRAVTTNAVIHPYLMYATLSVSSFHLSNLRPSQKDRYRWLAIAFQAKALKDINNIIQTVNKENCLAICLFSQQIGIHSFIDVFSNSFPPNRSFGTFLDAFVGSIRLLRGTYVVMTPWWSTLLTTEIGRILIDSENRHKARKPGDETLSLRRNINEANLIPADRSTYLESLESLQRYFDSCREAPRELLTTPSTVFTWLLIGSASYLTLLNERRPEALVILAFYAVALHRHRESWMIGDAGRFLFDSIAEHLGRHWDPWLQWPRKEISPS